VLTCIPHDEDQRVLIDELVRVLKPSGVLYISALGLQGDERNRDRYGLFQHKYGAYGVFETGDGAVCRHHTMEWLCSLVASCELLAPEKVEVATMNGHRSQAVQLLARKSPAEGREREEGWEYFTRKERADAEEKLQAQFMFIYLFIRHGHRASSLDRVG